MINPSLAAAIDSAVVAASNLFFLLAQDAGAGDAKEQIEPGFAAYAVPGLLGLLVFYLIALRPEVAKRKQHEKLVTSLKKNDRVVTVGGILGSVASVSEDGKEVTLKVDDNTRLRFLSNYISSVLTDEAGVLKKK